MFSEMLNIVHQFKSNYIYILTISSGINYNKKTNKTNKLSKDRPNISIDSTFRFAQIPESKKWVEILVGRKG